MGSFSCWVFCFKSGEKDTGDRPHSGRPAMAATMETKGCHMTHVNWAHSRNLKTGGCGHYQRTWLPKKCAHSGCCICSLADRKQPKTISAQNFSSAGACLLRIITADETFVHHYDQLMKLQSVEWYHQLSPCKIQFKAQTSAGTAMASVIWDSEESLLVEFLKRHSTINLERFVQALKKLKQQIWRVWPNRKVNQHLLLHDNTRLHVSLFTREAVAETGWIVVLYPPYSPDYHPPTSILADWRLFSEDARLAYGVSRKDGKSVLVMKRVYGNIISTL